MYIVDLYFRVRKVCLVEGMSVREASRVFGLHRDTVRKMLSNPVPPGYCRQCPPRRPKLDPYTGVIDRILEDDLILPKKQRHTREMFGSLRLTGALLDRLTHHVHIIEINGDSYASSRAVGPTQDSLPTSSRTLL